MEGRIREEETYRVVLVGIEETSQEKKELFCRKISENYSISFHLLTKIVDHCPIILKKNLLLDKAETLAKTLRSFGAIVSVEEKTEFEAFFLEFNERVPHQIALESCALRKVPSGAWIVIGRARNISSEGLNDTWALIQIFNDLGELVTFEEAPIPINPIPPGEVFPFKVIFEGYLSIKRVSIAFKNASGGPIPAADGRRNKEWENVAINDEKEEGSPSPDPEQSPEEIFVRDLPDNGNKETESSEMEFLPSVEEQSNMVTGKDEEQISGELFAMGSGEVAVEESKDIVLEKDREEDEFPKEGSGMLLQEERLNENGKEEDISQGSVGLLDHRRDPLEETHLDPHLCEESPQPVKETFPESVVVKEKEIFPWIKDFRIAIEAYYQNHGDTFTRWFRVFQSEGGFADSLHPLLTILVHARFSQGILFEKTLVNTQRVIGLIAQTNLRLEEIPSLEGTPFFSGENWRDLFHKAFPKIQQVANNILKKEEWNAIDLEHFIGVIPHMSDRNSRMSVRWIHELIPDVVRIDFSNARINVGENLYRVASRLGVVDPHFDFFQGKDSMGDLKIQSFARMAYQQYAVKIEEPMAWVGGREEDGGNCFPIHPNCQRCLFESFCPKLYFHLNPSGKGMRGR